MQLQIIEIESETAHFKVPYSTKIMKTFELPPPSTVIGMLKVIFGERIDDFIFGYYFERETKFQDAITIHKAPFKFNKSTGTKEILKNKIGTSDICVKEYLANCRLYIYTNLDSDIVMEYGLCMGRSSCPARLRLPFKETELNKQTTVLNNQFIPKTGKGRIRPITVTTKYNPALQSFESQIMYLQEARNAKTEAFYDATNNRSVHLWGYREGEVYVY